MGARARLTFALLACANAALAGLAAWGACPSRVVPAPPDATKPAQALARALVPFAQAPGQLMAEVRRETPKGARVAIALSTGHAYGEAAQAGALRQLLEGHQPSSVRGTAYAVVSLPAPHPAATPQPSAIPSATPSPKATVGSAAIAYRIRSGDTLFSISRAHYGGDASMFAAIYQQNRAVIGPNRSKLPTGATIWLPAAEASSDVTPHALPATPEATRAPLPPRVEKLAVWLSLPTPPAAPAPWPVRPFAAALGTLLLWLFGGTVARRARRHALQSERQRATSQIAARVLPHVPMHDLGYLRSSWRPELAQARLGEGAGLTFDLQALSESRIGLLISDATGQGPGAIAVRGLSNALWRARAQEALSPATTLLELNRLLLEFIPQGDHVTAFYAQLDLMSGACTYSAAGHLGAYVMRPDGALLLLGGRGLPLGVGQELFTERLEEGQQRLQAGDSLWLFSDGLVKAENTRGEPFGFERLEACLKAHAGEDAESLIAAVRDAHTTFLGRQSVDLVLACLRLAPAGQPLRAPQTQQA
ncbi:MAG TPA: SpoIIE family protein phosphatase [Oscillatoriaceae cyanobacterium]